MPLSAGDKLGPYEILALIGKGGMGEVYRAHDPRTGRDVAIKISAERFSERFDREVRAVAALNHPNICQIYDVGASLSGSGYLVMELIEGESPAQPGKAPMPLEEALKIARQIADALEAAHEKGITHRDLKPGNIKIKPDGTVKVLDFGLAKQSRDSDGAVTENSPTLSMSMTQAGVILGTAAYMAPEQAKGKPVDKRADIWAFGVVLYELLTGKRLFQHDDLTETLAAVVMQVPDLEGAPFQVRRLLKKCLEKDPKKRLRDIGDVWELLDVEQAFGLPVQAEGLLHKKAWIATAGVLALALAALAFIHFRESQPPERPLVRLDVDLGADVSMPAPSSSGSKVVISPDGARLVYVSGNPAKLFTRRLDRPKATELPGTELALGPFFSPEGQWIGFVAAGKLKKISVEGGAVVPLADVTNFGGASWGEDGNILVADALRGLVRVPAGGGTPQVVAELGKGELAVASPQILPGSKAVLFTSYATANRDAASIQAMTLADHHRKVLVQGSTSPRYLDTSNGAGYLVYTNKATLFAIPFDVEKLETRGTAVPILDDVAADTAVGVSQMDVSRTGTLIYRRSGEEMGGLTVAWIEGAGKTEPLLAKPGVYSRPSLSPSGERLAVDLTEGSGSDIWVYDWQRDTMTRVTFTGTADGPIWSPDGRYIAFRTLGAGMAVTRSDGAGKPQPLTQSKNIQFPWSFTPDGKQMAFGDIDSKSLWDLWTVPIESGAAGLRAGKPEVFLQTPANERSPTFSPDGRWLAYSSDESGTSQIYVRAFPDKGGKWQISNSGGIYPMWPRTGHDLFFETLDNQIMAAAYTVKGDSFVADKPRMWSDKKLGGISGNRNVSVAPDGKRIAALVPAAAQEAQQAQNQVVFLLNFFDELRRKAPLGAK